MPSTSNGGNFYATFSFLYSTIVVTYIVTAVYPQMAQYGAKKDFKGLKKQLGDEVLTMAILVIPASVGLFLFAEPIVGLIFLGGEFSQKDVSVTTTVLSFYSLGIVGMGFREIISRVFYTIMDAKIPVVNSIIMVGVNILLSIVLVRIMGIEGLALATTVSFIVGAGLTIVKARRKIGSLFNSSIYVELVKIIAASVVMGVL
ncbi:MAG: lipid II flippase MurJ [Peptoniphilus sp.]|nr:lipid II flippase MurJ [Peptoniphilus sp.]